ncbi:GNAT family N-acetyltransferase [Beggiatoa alba]|nr:GNAT family N-acetyltransferase [Beggiatoa alba]
MNIELKPFELADISRLLAWFDAECAPSRGGKNELLLSWAGSFFESPLTHSQCEQYWQTAQGDPPSRLIFKAVDNDSGDVVGHIELDGFDAENESAFISRVLVGQDTQRGQGVGRSIVLQLVNMAFSQLALHRLAVGVMDFNATAIRCYEKCGFQYEGRYRDIVKYEDQYYSVVTMSLLRSEWQQAANKPANC